MSERPIPTIVDESLNYSYKQFNGNHSFSSYNGKSAPKIYKYGRLNRTEDLIAQEISFKSASMVVSPIKSPLYDADRNSISYFDQCFEVITTLGEGSFGTVYKVRNLEDNKLYAIKESKETYRGHQYRKERLEEAKRYEQLSEHDNCVKLYKTWEQRGRLYMQMELCKYNLNMYVAENKQVPEKRIWQILLDMLLVLQALHSKNLLHLDIKLENILLSDDFTCKLGDFGLVIDMDSGYIQQANEGDSRYMAKELLAGKFTKAADIFSLGITILELSCNLELPNNGPLWQQLRNGIFPQFDDNVISKDLQYIIKWMMKPDPTERPDVQTLLEYKILSKLLMKRKAKKLAMLCINKIKLYSLCIVNSMCNLFSKVYKFSYGIFTYIVSSLQLKNMKKDHLTGSVSDDSDIDFSTSKMDINISSSTPIAAKYNNNNLTNKFVKRKRFPSNLSISYTDVINKSSNNNNNNNNIDNNDKYNKNNDKNNNSYDSSYENISMSRKKIIF